MVAAGSGSRLGAGLPKAFATVAGEPLVKHAVDAVVSAGCVDVVVVVVPPGYLAQAAALLPPSVVMVEGGGSRQESVSAGLAALGRAGTGVDGDVVLVHDAARCLAPASVITAVVRSVAAGHPVVIPVVAVHDTVRISDGAQHQTVDRSLLSAVQTPQGFSRAVLERAHAQHPLHGATDDASLAELLGVPVHLVPGSEDAFKITRPLDLVLAEHVVTTRRAGGSR